MRPKPSILAVALYFTLVFPMIASSQSIESRPRRVPSAQEPNTRPLAYKPDDLLKSRDAGEIRANAFEAASIESLIPREGLQFYFEVRNGGLGELAREARALGPVTKLLGSGPMKVSAADFSSFVIGNFGQLAGARIALVSYGANGAAVLVEAANDSDAQQLKAGISQLLGAGRTGPKAGQIDVDARSRMVVAGSRPIVDMLTEAGGAAVLANDQEFMKASGRFSNDLFFAYMDIGSMPLGLPTTADATGAAYAAGALAALNNRPYAIAMGGSFQGDAITLRALMLYRANQSAGAFAGLFSSITSPAGMGRPVAASFATTDSDLFVDIMIDWDKLYEGVESIMGMMAGAQSSGGAQSGGAQGADMFAMAEASLGFSIKNELLPTLGNELAISLSGFDRFLPSTAKAASHGPAKLPMPRFMLMVALKDPTGFEMLISRLISKQGGAPAQLAQAPYRGATISYNKDVAYAISGGFFIISGSVADIRRALDARAAGSSLASTAEFRAAVGSSQQAMMQAYLSPAISSKIFESILTEVVKANAELKYYARNVTLTRSAIGLTMTPDSDGLMMEMRAPTNLTFMALAAIATGKSAPYGITSAPAAGIGIPSPTTPAASIRNTDGRKVPKLSNDDLMDRRP
ncbi:MAG TPA: DUF3352 domain-containing protein [Blastocatellia bacterium]|jgi:hypothetical protein